MMMRTVAAWFGCLVLLGSGGATIVRAQGPQAPPSGAIRADRAKLRARLAGLRAEVELLKCEHDAARAVLPDILKGVWREGANLPLSNELGLLRLEVMAVRGNADALKTVEELTKSLKEAPGGLPSDKAVQEFVKKVAESDRALVERAKKEFVRRAAELDAKRLEVEELEAQYREPAARSARGGPNDADPPREASIARNLDTGVESCIDISDEGRVPILEPIAEGSSAACCLDPPTGAEVLRKIPKFKDGLPLHREIQRNNGRIVIEKIGEQVDPAKVYPLAGLCQLVHCHYKCTVSFDEISTVDGPTSAAHKKHRVEVVYLDKDYLRRSAPVPTAKSDGSAVIKASLPAPRSEGDSDLDRRMGRVEAKLDRILKALDDHRLGPVD